jgi:hypothetical protein
VLHHPSRHTPADICYKNPIGYGPNQLDYWFISSQEARH